MGSVKSKRVAQSDVIWKKVSCLPLANRKKGRKEFQWEAWNLFQMMSDGATRFDVTAIRKPVCSGHLDWTEFFYLKQSFRHKDKKGINMYFNFSDWMN